MKKPKICLTSSAGGHLHELLLAIKNVDTKNSYWVMYDSPHVVAGQETLWCKGNLYCLCC